MRPVSLTAWRLLGCAWGVGIVGGMLTITFHSLGLLIATMTIGPALAITSAAVRARHQRRYNRLTCGNVGDRS